MFLWPGSTEREVIDEAPKWHRVARRIVANFLLWILKEGEALEILSDANYHCSNLLAEKKIVTKYS